MKLNFFKFHLAVICLLLGIAWYLGQTIPVLAILPGAVTGKIYMTVNGTTVNLVGAHIVKQPEQYVGNTSLWIVNWYSTDSNGNYAVSNGGTNYGGPGGVNAWGGDGAKWCGNVYASQGGWCGMNCAEAPHYISANFPTGYTGFPYGNDLSTGSWSLAASAGTRTVLSASYGQWNYKSNVGNDITDTGYDFRWMPTKAVIKGRVTRTDNGAGIEGVEINQGVADPPGCVIGTARTNSYGYYSYTVDYQKGFCLRPPAVGGFSGPIATNADYIAKVGVAGTYECQVTGGLFPSCGNLDIGSDNNYDFTYCPSVNGGWSGWGTCSVSACGQTGTQTRTCNNPSPSCGGATCSGSNSQSCSTPACPTATPTPVPPTVTPTPTSVPPQVNSLKIWNSSTTQVTPNTFVGTSMLSGKQTGESGSNWLNPINVTLTTTQGSGAITENYVAFYDGTAMAQSSFITNMKSKLNTTPTSGLLLAYAKGTDTGFDPNTYYHYVWQPNQGWKRLSSLQPQYSVTSGATVLYDVSASTVSYVANKWQVKFYSQFGSKTMNTAGFVKDSNSKEAFNANLVPTPAL